MMLCLMRIETKWSNQETNILLHLTKLSKWDGSWADMGTWQEQTPLYFSHSMSLSVTYSKSDNLWSPTPTRLKGQQGSHCMEIIAHLV